MPVIIALVCPVVHAAATAAHARQDCAWRASLPEQLAHSPHTSTTAALSALGREKRRIGGLIDGGKNLGAVDFRDRIALFAGKHELALLVTGVAGKKGVAAFETMDDSGRHQGIDGPIDRDRRQPLAAGGHPLQHLVGADGLMRGGRDFLEHGLAQRGQPQSFGLERFSGLRHGLVEAMRRGYARASERLCWRSRGSLLPYTTAGLERHRHPCESNPKA